MRSGLGKRIIALGLAAALCFGDAMPTFAEELDNPNVIEIDASELNTTADASVEEIVESAEEIVEVNTDSDVSIEADEITEVASEEETDEEAKEEAEEVLDIEEEDVPTTDEVEEEEIVALAPVTVSGVTITVKGPADAFEEGTTVSVVELDPVEVMSAIEDEAPTVYKAFDIKLISVEGEEVQPLNDREISVSFEGDMIAELEDASVYHVDDDNNVTEMPTAVVEEENEDGEVVEVLEMATTHFSKYYISTNKNLKGNISWTVVDADDNNVKLAGVELRISRYTDKDNGNLSYDELKKKRAASTQNKTTDSSGKFTFEVQDSDSDWVYYLVEETKTAEGYEMPQRGWLIKSSYTYDEGFLGRKNYRLVEDIANGQSNFIYSTDPNNNINNCKITNEKTPVVNTDSVGVLNLYKYRLGAENDSPDSINKYSQFSFGDYKNERRKDGSMNEWSQATNSQSYGGIVKNVLKDGYPVLTASNNNGTELSLSYLFTEKTAGVDKEYTDVKGLFTKDTAGNYSFDSATKKAKLNAKTKTIATSDYKSSDTKGFWPLEDLGATDNRDTNGRDYFGLTYEVPFYQPAGGKVNGKDMIFEFSGDDDVWVFIDDVLVLDLGGIHGQVTGKINFATGEVTNPTYKNRYNAPTTIKKAFENANKATEFSSNTFTDYTQHTMKVFYFERGGSASNFKMSFNLATLPNNSVTVEKVVEGTPDNINAEYEFIAYFMDVEAKDAPKTYTVGTTTKNFGLNNTFKLKAGEKAVFTLPANAKVSVEELTKTADAVYVDAVKKAEGEAVKTAKLTSLEKKVNNGVYFNFKNEYNKVEITDIQKTATLTSWDNRTYDIKLTATVTGSGIDKVTFEDTVSDYFEIVEAEKAIVSGQKVTWSEVKLDSNGTATKTIKIKAKKDFLGGNVVPTNADNDGNNAFKVIVTSKSAGKDPISESKETPFVNVKLLELDPKNEEDTIFLGEDLQTYFTSEKENGMYTANVSGNDFVDYTRTWSKDSATVTTDSIRVSKPAEEVVYTITEELVPKAATFEQAKLVAESMKGTDNKVYYCEKTTKLATYTVKVVDGSIEVIKIIDATKIEWTDGDPIFTFELEHNGKKATKIAHFSKDKLDIYDGMAVVTVRFTGLEKGKYTVKELDTLGYTFESISNNVTFGDVSAEYKNVTPKAENHAAEVMLGDKNGAKFVDLGAMQIKNKKVAKYFMDRDEIVNTVTKAADGTITISSNGSKETKEFATKTALEEYVKAQNAKKGGKQ